MREMDRRDAIVLRARHHGRNLDFPKPLGNVKAADRVDPAHNDLACGKISQEQLLRAQDALLVLREPIRRIHRER